MQGCHQSLEQLHLLHHHHQLFQLLMMNHQQHHHYHNWLSLIFRGFVWVEFLLHLMMIRGLGHLHRPESLSDPAINRQIRLYDRFVLPLSKLLTPVMPLVYRPFMAGSLGGRRWGPWFYAPAMTALVTPPFFKFLVGPSRPNLRRDGRPGGLLVEKCRFLQESNCKGICLQMCKLPAQRYFSETLGMPLRSIIPLNPLALTPTHRSHSVGSGP